MKLIETINAALVELDAKFLANQTEWALGRKQAIKDFWGTPEATELKKNQYKLYDHLFAIAGGKTWYNVFRANNVEQVKEFVAKNVAATVAKRNALIARKLAAFDVQAVMTENTEFDSNGFQGWFYLNTDQGQKRVHIQVIYAGGYNIQCAHQRTLVKVK